MNDTQGPAGVVNSDVHLPLSFFKTQTDISLSNDCESTNIGVGGSTDCSSTIQNNGADDALVNAKIRSTAPGVASVSGDTNFNGTLTRPCHHRQHRAGRDRERVRPALGDPGM